MNMIWHNHEGMSQIMPENVRIVINRLHHHVCDGRLMQVECSAAGFVQQSIHGGKRLAGAKLRFRKRPVARKTIVETPSKDNGPVRFIKMRKPAFMVRHAKNSSRRQAKFSQAASRPGGLPHK